MSDSTSQLFMEIFLHETEGIHIWHVATITAVSFAAVLIVCIVFRKNGSIINKKKLFRLWLALEYALIIILITIVRRGFGERDRNYAHWGFRSFMKYISIPNARMFVLLNVLLFIPWGIVMSLYRSERGRLINVARATATGFLFSLCIECIQFITEAGFFEGVDILENTIVTLIGALIGEFIFLKQSYNSDIKFH